MTASAERWYAKTRLPDRVITESKVASGSGPNPKYPAAPDKAKKHFGDNDTSSGGRPRKRRG